MYHSCLFQTGESFYDTQHFLWIRNKPDQNLALIKWCWPIWQAGPPQLKRLGLSSGRGYPSEQWELKQDPVSRSHFPSLHLHGNKQCSSFPYTHIPVKSNYEELFQIRLREKGRIGNKIGNKLIVNFQRRTKLLQISRRIQTKATLSWSSIVGIFEVNDSRISFLAPANTRLICYDVLLHWTFTIE